MEIGSPQAARRNESRRRKSRVHVDIARGIALGTALLLIIFESSASVTAAGVTKRAMVSPAQTVAVGECSAPVRVQSQDEQYEIVTSGPPGPEPPPPSTSDSTGAGAIGREIPSPVYGVTLDDVSDVSDQVSSLQQLVHMPTVRVVFDYGVSPSYYASPIQWLRSVSYIMGQIADSSDMSKYTVSSYRNRAQNYVSSLGGQVDLWEIGNEVNGDWLGSGVMSKIQAAYDVVAAAHGASAITFFYEGEPSDPNNCISTDNGGNDMFTWINHNFHLSLPPEQRSAKTEKIRLGANYILISWYPDQCNNIQPDWTSIFSKLASIFPNSKLGFGELGTAKPQGGSQYELNLINQFYSLAKEIPLPASYVGGYFWWYYAEEMVPTNATILFDVLNLAIR